MGKMYSYVGPHELKKLLEHPTYRVWVKNPSDVLTWVAETKQQLSPEKAVTTTFIVDADGNLWIADRHSEHVICARGQQVRSAGEITFEINKQQCEVVEITNQSTGYCPEPESWESVKTALDATSIKHPSTWTISFIFRICPSCKIINIVKDDWYECAVCQSQLTKD